ncbi:MAG: hypothetical protein EOM34_15565 [Clostridia bacterium]|nr:hypothetical protein [Lachnospiraceae bacterium]NCC02059.1 hypothetical protein [Clostridia bacterium]NCD03924.1 hypothetical protein [Clostridia bacterium]
MKELLQLLTNADSICKQANAHYVKVSELEQEKINLTESLKKARTKWIIIGVVIWFISTGLSGLFGFLPVVGKILQTVISFGGLLLAC